MRSRTMATVPSSKVKASGLEAPGLGFQVLSLDFVFRVLGAGFRDLASASGLRVRGAGFWI